MRYTVLMGALRTAIYIQPPSFPVTTAADGVGFSGIVMFRNGKTYHSLLSSFHLGQNQNL